MRVQWCLKGIAAQTSFRDAEARAVLRDGLKSTALLSPGTPPVLSATALDQHVNAFGSVARTTPYLSLSAGQVVPDGLGGSVTLPALDTALDFATLGGQVSGYVFRLWTLVATRSAPDVEGVSEDVRDLTLYRQFSVFHDEGEIAAKLRVPGNQIEWVRKVNRTLAPAQLFGTGGTLWNPDFVAPEAMVNLRDEVT